MSVPSSTLVVGDVLVLGEGDAVGSDARLVSASALRVAEASLTGESSPVLKQLGALSAPAALGDRTNMVFKGAAVVRGVGRTIVTSTGMATRVGSIAEMLEATAEVPTPLEIEVARIGKMLGLIVVGVALVVMLTIIAVNEVNSVSDFAVVLQLGVSLAVAAVPEGLPAILSVVLAIGVQRLAKRNAVVKQLNSAEALGSTPVICTDKTGTLTRNETTVQRVVTASGAVEVTDVGYRSAGIVVNSTTRCASRRSWYSGRLACEQRATDGTRWRVADSRRLDRGGISRGGAEARGHRPRDGALRACRRNPLHLRAEDDVDAVPGEDRWNRDALQQGRA